MESETVRPIMRCALVVALMANTACTTRKSVTLDQLRVLGPERAWVTESDQSIVLMYEPKVVRDTLVGYVGKHREKVPGTGVKELRVQGPAPTRTVLLVVGIAAGVGGLLVLTAGTGQNQTITTVSGGAPGDCDKHPEQPICTGDPL